MPTGTVYSNWPTDTSPLRRVTSLCFSPADVAANTKNYLAIGNNKGKVLLYQVNHRM